ncbi:MAG: sulfate adenylyltransferase subunit 2 [Verrucomicrobia bacterium]|nr:sulfate adenylyltransferase subunit 2 [Verrucomicrobiota bacterium]
MSNRQRYSHLDALENQSVYIIREAYQKFGNLGLLWSIGKDSSVLLWLLRKAFFGHTPVPCVHVDTGYKLREMIEFRDRLAAEWGLDLVVGQNRAVLAEGRTFPNGRLTRVECCGALKKDALQAIIEEKGYDAVIVGIRRDEEGTRAKERYFSPRNRNFEWDFKEQPPELWDQFKTDYEPGTHIRVHPLLHWTELNVWEYIDREGIPIVDLYLARNGMRYRSLGCAPCTRPVPSTARSVREIIAELQTTRTSERSTRAQDQESEDAFERLRASGYM